MECGISTASLFSRYDVEDAISVIAGMGARVAEIFLNTHSEYDPEFIDILRERVRASDIRVRSVHAMSTQFEPQLFSIHARQRKDAVRTFEQVLDGAKKLGAEIYVMHGPMHMSGVVKNVEMERIGPIVYDLAEMAADYGVTLTWENVSWCLFCHPDFAPRILDASKSDKLRFTLDLKQAERSGYSPFEFLDRMGEKVANVHICDFRHEERLKFCMPGQGEFDFKYLRDRLIGYGYDGPMLIEVYSDLYQKDSELRTCFDSMSNLLKNRSKNS